MGYSAWIEEGEVQILPENLDAAYKVACDLNQRNDLKYGGSFPLRPENVGKSGPHDQIWFSWLPWNYPETCKFEFDSNPDDGIRITGFIGEKVGAEEYFLEALAPYIVPGGYLVWCGEDGDKWRQDFDGETMSTRRGKTVWE